MDTANAVYEDVENDDVATFTARFASGAVGTFSCSRVAWGLPNSLMVDVLGTRGRASWDLARCGEIKIDDVNSPADLDGARRVLVDPRVPTIGEANLRNGFSSSPPPFRNGAMREYCRFLRSQ